LDALPIGVCACDAAGLIVHVNPRANELWAVPARLHDLQHCYACVVPRHDSEDRVIPPPEMPIAVALQLRAAVPTRYATLVRPDGSSLAITSSAVPVFGEDHGLLGAIECFQEAPPIRGDAEAEAKHRNELRQRREQLRHMAIELSQAEHRTRRRVATSLHDELAQVLLVAQMKLRVLEQGLGVQNAQTLHDVVETLNDAMTYTRTLMHELAPPMLYDLGLVAALEALAEKYRQRHGLRVVVQDDDQPKPLSEDMRAAVFEAVRELLMNVVKYAHTGRARVALRRDGPWLLVSVEDGGVGFDPAKAVTRPTEKGGFGLFNIRQRFELLGGGVSIDAAPGKGARVEIRVALESPSS
jgi:signal transduction histidine kinase